MKSRTILWSVGLIILVGLFIYAGLNLMGGEPIVSASTDENLEPRVAIAGDPEADEPASVKSAGSGVTILTEDDRPLRLQYPRPCRQAPYPLRS